MPVEVILPKVDMDMTHGTLAVWHVSPGDEVAKGAALFDIETDKAAMEVEAPASGRLHAVTAQPGDRVAVGTVLALIYAEGEEISAATPAPAAAVAPAPAGPVAAALAPAETAPVADDARDDALRATPAARAAARRSGTDLAEVPGTGPKGRVQEADVKAHLEARTEPEPGPASATGWSQQAGPLHVSTRKGGRPDCPAARLYRRQPKLGTPGKGTWP